VSVLLTLDARRMDGTTTTATITERVTATKRTAATPTRCRSTAEHTTSGRVIIIVAVTVASGNSCICIPRMRTRGATSPRR
jgi:hypothetical protein